MKIAFDYKGATPEDLKTILELFYEQFKESLGTDGEPLEIGKINVYISLNNRTDNAILSYTNEGTPISWLVKNRELQKTNKKIVAKLTDTENAEDKLVVYQDIERENKRWR